MPLPKVNELRGLSQDELKMKREALEKGLNELRQKRVTGQLDKPHQFKLLRKQVAQINTIEREKKNADTRIKK